MTQLGNGLTAAGRHEDALSVNLRVVYEAAPWPSEADLLATADQSCGHILSASLGRAKKALSMRRLRLVA